MNLFVYGTLMCDEVWKAIIQRKYESKKGTLKDYSRRKLNGRLYPVMIPEKGNEIEGIVYFNISPPDIKRLDEFEGSGYTRIDVVVNISSTRQILCEAYLDNHSDESIISNENWDFDKFLEEDLDSFLGGFPGWKQI